MSLGDLWFELDGKDDLRIQPSGIVHGRISKFSKGHRITRESFLGSNISLLIDVYRKEFENDIWNISIDCSYRELATSSK